jgi:ABC-type amino acid transport substrate-binding protein
MRSLEPLLLALLVVAAGCPSGGGGGTAAQGGDLDAIKARKKLIVAMDIGYDPFEVQAADGSVVGYDRDLVDAVAQDLGVEVEIKNVPWVNIIPDLRTGKVDVIFSGMSVTEERRRAVAFSEPYYDVGQVIVKKKGDGRIRSYRDLDAAGMRVATQGGTTGENAVTTFMPKAELLRFQKIDEGCVALIQGKADAVVFDHPFLIKYATQQTTELEGLWEPFTEEHIAAAVRLESQPLLDAINATLTRLRQSGKLAELQAKWFPTRPGTTTAPGGQ